MRRALLLLAAVLVLLLFFCACSETTPSDEKGCVTHEDCPSGYYCAISLGICAEGNPPHECVHDMDCAPGYACDTSSGKCVPADGDFPDGDLPDGDAPDGDVPDGDAPDCAFCTDFPGRYCGVQAEGEGCQGDLDLENNVKSMEIQVSEAQEGSCAFDVVLTASQAADSGTARAEGCEFTQLGFSSEGSIDDLPYFPAHYDPEQGEITLAWPNCELTFRKDCSSEDGDEEENPDPCESGPVLACGDVLSHSTITQGRANRWSGYTCSARSERGRETLYSFPNTGRCRVTFTLSGLTTDLDLFVLDICDPSSCLAFSGTPLDIQGDEVVTFEPQPGRTYVVSVDGYDESEGSYTLAVTCDCDDEDGDEEEDEDEDEEGESCEGCRIGGVCYADADLNPVNSCEICSVSDSLTEWTARQNGESCDDGDPCTRDDQCQSDKSCAGGHACHEKGVCDPLDGSCDCYPGYDEGDCSLCATGFENYPACTTTGFVAIPAGAFWMGSPSGCPGPEGYPGTCTAEAGRTAAYETLHRVELTYGFEMQTQEVTQAEFAAFAARNPSYFSAGADGNDCGATCPVERVNWFEAAAYANWLSTQKGLTPCYTLTDCTGTLGGGCGASTLTCSGYSCTVALNGVSTPQQCEGYRLPTEAEWEYAIRAGSTTAFYPSEGNDGTITNTACSDPNMDQIGWYCGNNGEEGETYGTKPTGGKEANAWGLYDMSGNVMEWTGDWFQQAYQDDAGSDPVGPETGSMRVQRGGVWSSDAKHGRSAYRTANNPVMRVYNVGLRLVRSRPESP